MRCTRWWWCERWDGKVMKEVGKVSSIIGRRGFRLWVSGCVSLELWTTSYESQVMGYKLRAPSYESQVGHSGRPASSEIDADDVDLCDRWKCQMKFRISANLWTGRTINWPGETEQFGVNLACGESREKVISGGKWCGELSNDVWLERWFWGRFQGKDEFERRKVRRCFSRYFRTEMVPKRDF